MKNLATKLVKILASAESVTKSGWNSHQQYHYATEEDVLAAVKKALIENKVFISESSKITDVKEMINDKGKKSLVTSVETTHTFIDAESGETHTVTSCGQGHDSMDKGVFKAITGATKYFFMKNMMISTGDDPERDSAPTSKTSKSSDDDFDKPAQAQGRTAAPQPAKTAPAFGKPAMGAKPSFGAKPALGANSAAPATIPTPVAKAASGQGRYPDMSAPTGDSDPEF